MYISLTLGDQLRYWRGQRGKSQLDLSLEAGISQRHISFVESGRSIPSRKLLLILAHALDVPLRERNALLFAAGYAPAYDETPFDSPSMSAILTAINQLLKHHEPYPALVLDRYWNIVHRNEAAPRFFGQFIDLASYPEPRNLLHLVFDPNALRPFIEDWPTVASALLGRVQREAIGHILDTRTVALLDELKHYPDAPTLSPPTRPQTPIVPITFVKGGHRSTWFSLITTVGTPQDITAQELRVECMYPAEPTP